MMAAYLVIFNALNLVPKSTPGFAGSDGAAFSH